MKDEHNEERDMILAKHVMNIHVNAMATEDENSKGELSLNFLKKFINYSRSRCGPRISHVSQLNPLASVAVEHEIFKFSKAKHVLLMDCFIIYSFFLKSILIRFYFRFVIWITNSKKKFGLQISKVEWIRILDAQNRNA